MVLEQDLISVIIPVYNGENYISEALNSIIFQTYRNLEILIIDGGSTDSTIKIIKKYKDSRIILFENKRLNLIDSLNLGISAAKGKYIARMDADDISHPKRLETQIKHLKKENLDLCGTSYTSMNNNKLLVRRYIVPTRREDIIVKLSSGVPFCHGSILAKKTVFDDNQYGNGIDKVIEDYSLWVDMLKKKIKISNCKENLYFLRIHPNSLTQKQGSKIFKRAFKVALDHITFHQDELVRILAKKSFLYFLLSKSSTLFIDYLYLIRFISRNIKIYNFLEYLLIINVLTLKITFFKLISLFEEKFNFFTKNNLRL